MTWEELIKNNIERLEGEKAAAIRRLDKIRGDNSANALLKK